ncbi:Uncharacterised protein [Mycobacteroides abscessus subsp. abscessus]|nr:Uncharacterised protein [Mycobacteroides abscessus subsp. abscessus]
MMSPMNMPTEPQRSSTRRPMRSTNRIATNVITTLIADVMTDVVNAESVLKPTDVHRLVE